MVKIGDQWSISSKGGGDSFAREEQMEILKVA